MFQEYSEFNGLVDTPLSQEALNGLDPSISEASDAIARECSSVSNVLQMFPRLRTHGLDGKKRSKIVKICMHLFNLRLRRLAPPLLQALEQRRLAGENPISLYHLDG